MYNDDYKYIDLFSPVTIQLYIYGYIFFFLKIPIGYSNPTILAQQYFRYNYIYKGI